MQELITRIKDLQDQLQVLGYHKYQIHNIMHEVAGEFQIETLSPNDQEAVIHNLEEYINFARRCWHKHN